MNVRTHCREKWETCWAKKLSRSSSNFIIYVSSHYMTKIPSVIQDWLALLSLSLSRSSHQHLLNWFIACSSLIFFSLLSTLFRNLLFLTHSLFHRRRTRVSQSLYLFFLTQLIQHIVNKHAASARLTSSAQLVPEKITQKYLLKATISIISLIIFVRGLKFFLAMRRVTAVKLIDHLRNSM